MPICQQCGDSFIGQRVTAKFCSSLCRLRAHRGFPRTKPKDAEPPSAPAPASTLPPPAPAGAADNALSAIALLRAEGLLTNRYAPFIGRRKITCEFDHDNDDDDEDDEDDFTGHPEPADPTTAIHLVKRYGEWEIARDDAMDGDFEDLSDLDYMRLIRQRLYGALCNLDCDLDVLERREQAS